MRDGDGGPDLLKLAALPVTRATIAPFPSRQRCGVPDVLIGLHRRQLRVTRRPQRTLGARGVTLHTPDALIAGTARAHGATVVTDNVSDFPMAEVRVLTPEQVLSRLTH